MISINRICHKQALIYSVPTYLPKTDLDDWYLLKTDDDDLYLQKEIDVEEVYLKE